MAGTQTLGETSENPVAINVTAMVDVIFCLCIFFMCSFHFKQLEGRMDTWLPKDGPDDGGILLEEIRVFFRYDPSSQRTLRHVGNRLPAQDDAALMKTIGDMANDYRRVGRQAIPVLLDASPDVPWTDVVHVIDLCKAHGLDRIDFAAP